VQQVGARKLQGIQGGIAELEVSREAGLGAEPGSGSSAVSASNLGSSALVCRIVS